jgi:Ca2+:H+ antiporter
VTNGSGWTPRWEVAAALPLLCMPAAVIARAQEARVAAFCLAVAALVPVAGYLGRATTQIALRSNATTAAIVSAALGNAVELVICARLLLGDEPDAPALVKASIVGSLVTNLLLLVGASMIAGGLKYTEQRFNPLAAGVSASLLFIAVAGVSLPALYGRLVDPTRVPVLSRAVSVVLALVYVASIVFSAFTHRHLFDTTDETREVETAVWSPRRSILIVFGSVLAAAFMADVIESTVRDAGRALSLSPTFVGVIVLGFVTNVAENLAAIGYARRNLIDLSFQVGTSAGSQILLFVVPILVLIAAASGRDFALDFSPFEVVCMVLPVLIMNLLATDGRCNWLEGIQLVGLYLLIGVTFYFVP